LKQAFMFAPTWGHGTSQHVKKYRNIEHFLNSSDWNKNFKLV
jgi:hypothetical protein